MIVVIITKFLWLCRVIFMFEIIMNMTMILPAEDIRKFFSRHRVIAFIVMAISVIGFLSFVLKLIIK